jgi:hypothetical protein
MTVHRLTKTRIREFVSGGGSAFERAVRRSFARAMVRTTRIARARMCQGCGRPKAECNCPKDMAEAVRRYHAVIERIRREGREVERAERIKRRRAKFRVVD